MKKNLVLEQLKQIEQEIKTFNWEGSSQAEKQQEIKKIATQLTQINKAIPLADIVELGGDAVSVANCAINPINPIICLAAIIALIDVIKLAKQKKDSK